MEIINNTKHYEAVMQFFDTDAILLPVNLPRRVDCKNGRFYEYEKEDETTVSRPSATTIIDKAIPKGTGWDLALKKSGYLEWEKMTTEAAESGTKIHIATEMYELGHTVDLEDWTEKEYRKMLGFIQFIEDVNPELVTLPEITLVNENLPFAGTIDRVYRIDGKIVILDIKTGKEYNPQHMIQLEMYAQLFESEFGVTVDYLADLYLKEWRSEKPKYLLRKHKRNPEAVETTMRMYSLMNENKGPVRRMEIPPSIRREDEKDN